MKTFFLFVILATVAQEPQAWSCGDLEPTQISIGSYKPRGVMTTMAGMTTYEVGPSDATAVLIGIHDIFGFNTSSTNLNELADLLSDGGYKVILPDFLGHNAWTNDKGPPFRNPAYNDWLVETSWNSMIRAKVRKILDDVETKGFKNVGMFGISYGGQKVSKASIEFSSDFKVAVRFTSAPIFLEEAESIGVPTLLIGWKKRDLDFTEYCHLVESNLGPGTCVYKQYEHQDAVFMGSESDWTNDNVRTDAQDAIDQAKKFVCQFLLP